MAPHQIHLHQETAHPPPYSLSDYEVESEEDQMSWSSDSKELLAPAEWRSTVFMILLTSGMGGVQLVFSVLYSHGMAHLRSLGLSKSETAIVFISGPLTGIFVQPFFGIWSDHCRLSLGKRRPFIAFGGALMITSLLCLAWTKSIVSAMFSALTDSSGPQDRATATMAGVLTFCIFFAVQPAQGGVRALIVDTCLTQQQQLVNAWVGRVSCLANVLGYLSAFVDLSQYLSCFGDTQFKKLSVLAALVLACTILLTCTYVVEKNPSHELQMESNDDQLGYPKNFRNCRREQLIHTYHELMRLPKQITRICWIQCFAWLGWYPYLLYVTTYLGEVYIAESGVLMKNASQNSYDATWEKATRLGSLAPLASSTVSLLSAVFLPYLTQSPYSCARPVNKIPPLEFSKSTNTPRLTMRFLWLLSHGLFSLCVLATLFISSVAGSVVIFGLTGIAWAVTSWIPYTLLSIEISQRNQDASISARCGSWRASGGTVSTGTAFGLHNVAICLPQIVISVASSIVWKSQADSSKNDPRSTGWVLRAGAVATLVALVLTSKIRDPTPEAYYEKAREEMVLERLGVTEQQLPLLGAHQTNSPC